VADSSGSYPSAFYMAGCFVLLSAFLIFLVPFFKRHEKDERDATVNELLLIVEKCTVV